MDDFLCVGDWDSKINTASDGFFELHIDQSTGDITGFHIHDNGDQVPVFGTCTHAAPQNPTHHIDILEPSGNSAYRFKGVIVPDNSSAQKHKVPNGKRYLLQSLRGQAKAAAAAAAADDWVAEKTT